MNAYIYIALLLATLSGFCFGILLVASVTEEPIINQMQPNYYGLLQDQIQLTNLYKQNYYACIVESTDTKTKVTLIE